MVSSVIINIGEEHKVLNDPRQSQSLFRKWRRLSRLQKSIAYIIFIVLVISYFQFGGSFNSSSVSSIGSSPVSVHKSSDYSIDRLPGLNDIDKLVDIKKKPIGDDANEDFDDENEAPKDDEDGDIGEGKDSNNAGETEGEMAGIVFSGPTNDRQREVTLAFQHAWTNYKEYAWGHDHLKPITGNYDNWFGLGLTIIDGMDTAYVMNLKPEFEECVSWVKDHLNFNKDREGNLFETTIRVLGGLLSSFHLSGKTKRILLEKAMDLGNRLMGAFKTNSGIPLSDVNFKSALGRGPKWSPDSSTSEVSTIQLEFRDLSRATKKNLYEEAAFKVSEKIHSLKKLDGLVPIFIRPNSGVFNEGSVITLGARGDSYYEYLLKQWIQTGKTIDFLRDDYVEAVNGIQKHLVKRTSKSNLIFISELTNIRGSHNLKMDELVCFLPGTLVLGVLHGMPQSHLELAKELLQTCYLTFARQPTGLAGEIAYFKTSKSANEDFTVKSNDAHYLLRPETIESLWYMYYFTKNQKYQNWGWEIFQAIQNFTKVDKGYSTIGNVKDRKNLQYRNKMESYFLAETLKYLYLLFADKQEIDLNKWVFNTEGHPLPVHAY